MCQFLASQKTRFCFGSLHMRKLLDNSYFHFTEPHLCSFVNKEMTVATLSGVLVPTKRISGSVVGAIAPSLRFFT